jgi:hypothetical protein
MMVHLWHFTKTETVKLIRAQGFKTRYDLNRLGNDFVLPGEMSPKSVFGPALIEVWIDLDRAAIDIDYYKWSYIEGSRSVVVYRIPDHVVNDYAIKWRFTDNIDVLPPCLPLPSSTTWSAPKESTEDAEPS